MNELTPIQEAIKQVEKIKKNLQNKSQINDLDCLINFYKINLLPKEEKIIINACEYGNAYDTPVLIDGKDYYNNKFKQND